MLINVDYVTGMSLTPVSLFAQILLWLRQQMSREKDAEEGDRRGLVEEGTVCPPDDANKTTKTSGLTEAKWVPESVPEISAAASAIVVTTASDNITTKVNSLFFCTVSKYKSPIAQFFNFFSYIFNQDNNSFFTTSTKKQN